MKGTVVVIPAFNEARTILSVISAVCEQDVDRVIAVDDGSSDDTAALISRFFDTSALQPNPGTDSPPRQPRQGLCIGERNRPCD